MPAALIGGPFLREARRRARTVDAMQVFATAPDRDGVSWRVEMRERGEVRVHRLTGRAVAQTPLRRPTDIRALGT